MARGACRSILRALISHHRVHASIHDARTGIRRLRALLALLGDPFGEVDDIDRILQRVGKSLSALRDAHVAIATAERLSKQCRTQAWLPVIERLVLRRDGILRRALARDAWFQLRRARIERVASRLEAMDWRGLRAVDLRSALKRSRRRVGKAGRRVKRDPSAPNLHRWRRRVRKLRMQVDAIAQIAPAVAKKQSKHAARADARSLRKLADRLGRLQDEAVLRDILRRMMAGVDGATAEPSRSAVGPRSNGIRRRPVLPLCDRAALRRLGMSDKMDAATSQALIERLVNQRLPRTLDLKKRVDGGERLRDGDIAFLKEMLDDANRSTSFVMQHPGMHSLAGQLVDLYSQIMRKALENEQKGA